jgi:hypothetical protein
MDGLQMLKQSMDMGLFVLKQYVSDLSDAELMQRPGPGCNHIAWQLGHLISSEVSLMNIIKPGSGAELPAGFAEKHSKETAGSDDAAKFCTKQEYLDLYDKVRESSWKTIQTLTDADLDQPGPERMRAVFPKISNMVTLVGLHPLMHAGQLVPLRRKLGKPVLI